MAGLSGHVYLFDKFARDTRTADGRLVVELYAAPPDQPQAPPARLEVWEINKETLNKQCLSKDRFGLGGYTLNLPWPSYRPDIGQVLMRMRYEHPNSMPVYAADAVLTLNSGTGATPVYTSRRETGDRQPVATAAPPGQVPQAGMVPQVAGMPQAPPQQAGGVQQAAGLPPAPVPPPIQLPQQGWPVQQVGGAQAPAPAMFPMPVPQSGGVQQAGALPPLPYQMPQQGGPVQQVGGVPPQQAGGVQPPPAPAPYQTPLPFPGALRR
jgi:hypothetical protein